MHWVLFASSNPLPGLNKPYHHTIDGQIFTVIVITTLALIVLYAAYRNFIIGKPTSDAI
jgi:hypothetical protein